jgi:hypothetical protein
MFNYNHVSQRLVSCFLRVPNLRANLYDQW